MQAGQQLRRGAPAAILMLAEEGGEALLAEAGGAVRGGVAAQEGERDRAVDIGEDGGGAGPEPLEQAAQLVGQGDARGDQVVAAAHQRAQGLDRVRARGERAEAVAVGAQQVGQQVGVAQDRSCRRRRGSGAARP